MRKPLVWLLAVCLALTACSEPSGPERRSLIGTWTSTGFSAATVRLTLTESARNVNGAGSWVEATQARAFRVTGVHAEQVVSLIFQFQNAADLNFRGEFTAEHTLVGTLTGGDFREQPITFERVQRESD